MNTRVWGLAATLRRAFMLLVASALLAACGGGGGGGNQPQNKLPVAKAGIDAVVREAETVSFDGRGSSDPDGTIAGYTWSVPAGSSATLENAETAQPTLTAGDVETDTDIALTLDVTDNKGGKASDTLNVTIFRHVDGNTPPTPVAKPVPETAPGDPVTLDASDSFDSDGAVTAYRWAQISGPVVDLSGVDNAVATFQAPADIASETMFLFRLFVTDNADAIGERNAIDVAVTVKPAGDQPPAANAGADQTVNAGDTVVLDGTASGDVETAMEALQFAWAQTEGNDTVTVALDDPASVTPTFTLPEDIAAETVLVFELTVTDEAQQIAIDSVAVTVKPLVPGNQLPTADAGADQTVTENDDVFLNGTGSDDADGSIASYQWTQIGKPLVTLENADTDEARFVTPLVTADTTLRFRLTVTDNQGAVASDTVDVFISDSDQEPQAIAKANGSVDLIEVNDGVNVTLDGSASVDDGTITSYAWSADSNAIEIIPDLHVAALASFTAPAAAGDYTITLTVTDDGGFADSDTITVTVKENLPPLADASANGVELISANGGAEVTLNGSGSDPESRPLKQIAWKHLPEGEQQEIALTDANKFAPRFIAPNVSDTFTFELKVTDDRDQQATDTVRVQVAAVVPGNTAPVAVVPAAFSVDENTTITLDGSASHDDDEGDSIASYQWTQTAGPPVTLNLANPAKPTFEPEPVGANTPFTFQLVVADQHGVFSAPVSVTVTVRDTGIDTMPDPITFASLTGVEIHQTVTSNFVLVTGIDTPVPVSVRIIEGSPGSAFARVTRAADGSVSTFLNGTLNPFDRIELVTIPRSLGEHVRLRLLFGDPAAPVYQTDWSVTAKLTGDQSPAPFDLQDIEGAAPGNNSFTNEVTPTGFDTATLVVITGEAASFAVVTPGGDGRTNIVHPGESFRIRVRPNAGNYERTLAVNVRMGETVETFNYTTRARDSTPVFNPDALPVQTDLDAGATVSTLVQLTGFDESLTATVTGPDEAAAQLTVVGSADLPAASQTVFSGNTLLVEALAPPFNIEGGEASHTVTLNVGTESRDLVIGTRAPNRMPGSFEIAPKTDVAVGAGVRSESFIVPGVEVPVPVAITAVSDNATAVLLKNGVPVASDGSVSAGPEDDIVVELTTPEEVSVTVSATVTVGLASVGQQSAVFEVTTAAVDTTPDNFDFAAVSGAVRGELVESNVAAISGITDGETAAVAISGDTDSAYAVKRTGEPAFGAFTTEPGTVSNGDEVKVRVRAAEAFGATTLTVLDVGGRLEEFVVMSEIDAAPPQVEITFPINGSLFNAEVSAGGISQQTVFAKVSDNDAVSRVRINDQEAAFDAAVGQWKAKVDVGPGENGISLTANDPAGNVGEAVLSVFGETGMFGDMVKIRWAGGKLYSAIEAGTASRLLEIDPVTGTRRTIKLPGVNGVADFIPDNIDNPTRFYILSDATDIIYTFDIAGGTGTLLSPSTQTPDIFTTSPLQVVTNNTGTHLLAAVSNSTTGVQLIQVLPDGTRRSVATLAGYSFVNGFSISGTTGWLFARNVLIGAGAGVIVKMDLSDLENVVTTDQRAVSADVLNPITFSESTQLHVDVTDGDGEPLLFVLGSAAVVALQSDGSSSNLVTGYGDDGLHGTGPSVGYLAYRGITMNPSGDLYLVDADWSAIVEVDRIAGDRTVLSGLHGNHVPAEGVRSFSGPGVSQVLGMTTLPDGRLIAERIFSPDIAGSVRKVAAYDVVNGSWSSLFDGQLDVDGGGAFEFLPVSDTEFLVGHDRWRTPTTGMRQGIGRVFQDADTGEWQQELLSVAADGKTAGEDWNFLRAAARDPANGDIWVLSSFADDFKLFQVDLATGNRVMALDLPASIDGFTPRGLSQSVHRLAFAEDGRLFWLADSTTPSRERVFVIDREAQNVSLYSEAGFITSPDDLVVDEHLQLAYLAGDFAARAAEMDILSGSPGEGTGGLMTSIPFPALNIGQNTSDHVNLVLDAERRRLWVYQPRLRTMYLLQPDTGEVVILPKH